MKPKGWIDEPLYNRIKEIMPIPTVDLLVTHRGRLLLMLRNNEPAKDQWFTPGGRILRRETIDETVRRVLQEETGLTPRKITRIGIMEHIWPMTHTVTILHRVDITDNTVTMNDEHSDYKGVNSAPEDAHPLLRQMIQESKIFQQ